MTKCAWLVVCFFFHPLSLSLIFYCLFSFNLPPSYSLPLTPSLLLPPSLPPFLFSPFSTSFPNFVIVIITILVHDGHGYYPLLIGIVIITFNQDLISSVTCMVTQSLSDLQDMEVVTHVIMTIDLCTCVGYRERREEKY